MRREDKERKIVGKKFKRICKREKSSNYESCKRECEGSHMVRE
jgi:hypothetical protein